MNGYGSDIVVYRLLKSKSQRCIAVGIVVACLAGCSGSPRNAEAPEAPTAVSEPSTAPAASPSPSGEIGFDRELALFDEIVERYEAPIDEADNGYFIVEPLLSGVLPEAFDEESLYDISLESSEQRKLFDEHLLPILTEGFTKSLFRPNGRLVVGDVEVDYRGLRHLVILIGQRAEQHWSQGEKAAALKLLRLPLSLSQAMRERPETASINLFSSSYAEVSLDLVQTWTESSTIDEESIRSLRTILEEAEPDFSHLQETVVVDFAQLLNSLETEAGRERLGIGLVEDERLQKWRDELLTIYREALELYGDKPIDATAFNRTVLDSSSRIQGLVIDYPEVATMQKRALVRYKATELGLAMMLPNSEERVETLINEPVAREFLKIDRDDERVRLIGQPGQFEVLAPGVEPIFFEYTARSSEK